mgnify:CR=1 FL=1
MDFRQIASGVRFRRQNLRIRRFLMFFCLKFFFFVAFLKKKPQKNSIFSMGIRGGGWSAPQIRGDLAAAALLAARTAGDGEHGGRVGKVDGGALRTRECE